MRYKQFSGSNLFVMPMYYPKFPTTQMYDEILIFFKLGALREHLKKVVGGP